MSLPLRVLAIGATAVIVGLTATPASPIPNGPPTDTAAVSKALDSIVAGDAMKSISTLTQDAWEGRMAGHPGCKKAGDWIGKRFAQMGLKPIGDNQSHFQEFTFKNRDDSARRRRPTDDKKKKKKKRKKKKKPSGPPVSKPHTKTPTSRNVVGFWKGTDPQVNDQVIIIGAHYDHVGRLGQWNAGRRGGADGADDIYNGADDNASGTSAVLEIVEAFTKGKIRTRRSILFICFSAEEHGLFGSKWYCDHPIIPLNKTVAMMNLDMVGYNHKKEFEVVGVAQASDGVIRTAVKNAMKRVSGFKAKLGNWAKREDSDHAPFIKVRVPATFFFSGMHKVYHTVNDEARGISGRRIANAARVVFLTSIELANLEKTPTYVHWDGSGGAGGKLGIVGAPLSRNALRRHKLRGRSGGILVREVKPKSLAAAAGVKPRDVIIAVGGVKISRGAEFKRAGTGLKRVKPGRTLAIKVIRGGSRKTLKTTVPK